MCVSKRIWGCESQSPSFLEGQASHHTHHELLVLLQGVTNKNHKLDPWMDACTTNSPTAMGESCVNWCWSVASIVGNYVQIRSPVGDSVQPRNPSRNGWGNIGLFVAVAWACKYWPQYHHPQWLTVDSPNARRNLCHTLRDESLADVGCVGDVPTNFTGFVLGALRNLIRCDIIPCPPGQNHAYYQASTAGLATRVVASRGLGKSIDQPTRDFLFPGTILPLLGGHVSQKRAKRLLVMMRKFWTRLRHFGCHAQWCICSEKINNHPSPNQMLAIPIEHIRTR